MAQKAAPLYHLLHIHVKWDWNTECESSYNNLKESLTKEPVFLAMADPDKPFTLDTDASTEAIAAVLMQKDENNDDHAIAYASRTLTETERNWPIRDLEAYAIVWSIQHFRSFLRDVPTFEVRTDHQSLQWLWKIGDNRRIARWSMLLSEYTFTIKYRAGKKQQHVDVFTRDMKPDRDEEEHIERICIPENIHKLSSQQSVILGNFEIHNFRYMPSIRELSVAVEEEIMKDMVQSRNLKCVEGIFVNEYDRIYIPRKYRDTIMYIYHYGEVGGHGGVNRTYNRIRNHFYRPRMEEDLQKYIDSCLTCRRRRIPHKQPCSGTLKTLTPFDVVACDMVGPLKARGNTHFILSMIDHFSRYPEAILVSGKITSSDIWQVLNHRWFAIWGFPTALLTDNAMVYQSYEMRRECARLGIGKIYCSPYYPQGNSILERFHGFLKHTISTFVSLTEMTIQEIITNALIIYRSTPHTDTRETPFYLLTGLDMMLPQMQTFMGLTKTRGSDQRLKVLASVRGELMQKVAIEHERTKEPRTTNKTEVKVGDLVLFELPSTKRTALGKIMGTLKLAPLWSEPCRVHKISDSEVKSIWASQNARLYPISISKCQKLHNSFRMELMPEYELELINEFLREEAKHGDAHTQTRFEELSEKTKQKNKNRIEFFSQVGGNKFK